MATAAQADPVRQMKQVVDETLARLSTDAVRLHQRLLDYADTGAAGPVPQRTLAPLIAARRHTLHARARIAELDTEHPAKRRLLHWLTLLADALAAMRRTLAEADFDEAGRYKRIAHRRTVRASKAFLSADRALSCLYGCDTVVNPRPRTRP